MKTSHTLSGTDGGSESYIQVRNLVLNPRNVLPVQCQGGTRWNIAHTFSSLSTVGKVDSIVLSNAILKFSVCAVGSNRIEGYGNVTATSCSELEMPHSCSYNS